MERVRLTIDPTTLGARPMHQHLTSSDEIDETQIINWNVADQPTTFLLRIYGSYDHLEPILAASSYVEGYEILPLSDRNCYCYLRGEATAASRSLFEVFTQGTLLTIPPIVLNEDETVTLTLVGAQSDMQAAMDALPDAVTVTIEEVGGSRVATESIIASLPTRQREALEVAVARGYYEIPRTVTLEQLATDLECATATAAEHLRKAESRIITSLIERVTA
ncbi:helix-turn-helix domain-containing protein [Haloarcula nitratireducens]|uniref:Helix-turn-helix domain-containing protein n=1 Tax=Haloarcula nitratireducens TaxID=2487749 RepID=A0AAW4PG74_9EURY|nr:helix-turn-helix domain-containing protein [Halomicroarcula nitratireducens]MBX0296653.1 helix-turn-helix domain-containing protein [Halomicroarcula nitratireducens]